MPASQLSTTSLKDFKVPYLLTAPMLMTAKGGGVVVFWIAALAVRVDRMRLPLILSVFWIAALAVHADQTRLPLIRRACQIWVRICQEMLTKTDS